MLEKIARGEKRALLSLATGSGKTFIAVHLLKRIADAGQLRRALFVCDRDELRSPGPRRVPERLRRRRRRGLRAEQSARRTPASSSPPTRPSTWTRDDADANFLLTQLPRELFSHIVIDECHRSAWGKWSQVLTRNPDAVQIGLTATPRQLKITDEDQRRPRPTPQITADNLRLFGEPVYEYDMAPGHRGRLPGRLRDHPLRHLPRRQGRQRAARPASTAGRPGRTRRSSTPPPGRCYPGGRGPRALRRRPFEDQLLMPDRVTAMCQDLFACLLDTGGPEQKTIIFCARDRHADDVAAAMNNLYADWCARTRPAARRALRLQVHRRARRQPVPGRPARRLPPPLHRHHRGPAHHRRGRALRAQHRLLQVRALADRLLPDGRARHAHWTRPPAS